MEKCWWKGSWTPHITALHTLPPGSTPAPLVPPSYPTTALLTGGFRGYKGKGDRTSSVETFLGSCQVSDPGVNQDMQTTFQAAAIQPDLPQGQNNPSTFVAADNPTSTPHISITPGGSTVHVANLPKARYGHVTFLTADTKPIVVTCGGDLRRSTRSCLTLHGGRWAEGVVRDLPGARRYGSAVTLPGHGVYLVGGRDGDSRYTSDFLEVNSTVWRAGPTLPVSMYQPCTAALSASFLAIYGKDIREFDPSSGWRSPSTWPSLLTSRTWQPGCTVVGSTVIIAGGTSTPNPTTEMLNIQTRTIRYGPNMVKPRALFHLLTVQPGDRAIALGGLRYFDGTLYRPNEVEELIEGTWRVIGRLDLERSSFGGLAVPTSLLCGEGEEGPGGLPGSVGR